MVNPIQTTPRKANCTHGAQRPLPRHDDTTGFRTSMRPSFESVREQCETHTPRLSTSSCFFGG